MEREQRERVRLVSPAEEKGRGNGGRQEKSERTGRVRGRGERKSAFNAMFNEERERKKGWDLV
jgi:hypothetical protein